MRAPPSGLARFTALRRHRRILQGRVVGRLFQCAACEPAGSELATWRDEGPVCRELIEGRHGKPASALKPLRER